MAVWFSKVQVSGIDTLVQMQVLNASYLDYKYGRMCSGLKVATDWK